MKTKRLIAGLASILLVGAALPAHAEGSVRERALKRCQENRGVDCKTEQGLRPWIDEEIAVQHRHVIGAQQRGGKSASPPVVPPSGAPAPNPARTTN
jgi:hypothetical protein